MKLSTMVLVAVGGYLAADKFGHIPYEWPHVFPIDASRRGQTVLLKPGKTYAVTVYSPGLAAMVPPGVNLALSQVPPSKNYDDATMTAFVQFTNVPGVAIATVTPKKEFTATVGQGFGDESAAEVQITRIREL
jgi:hypothetical protein